MKMIRSLLIFLMIFTAIASVNAQQKIANPKIKVYYFHSSKRCNTCIAIEENTKKTLNDNFSTEMKNGIIIFASVNVDEEKNVKLAEEYEAAGSSLFITTNEKGKDIKKDMTNFAFTYGRSNPAKFIDGLKEEIAKDLK